jgi:ADP-ribose pyrophosphatase YjhB (NUDIX family)
VNFCSQCGAAVGLAIPEGEDRERHVCRTCGFIHYENPKTVVGCLPELDGKLLLCRRAIEPAIGRWTVPAGYLELGESVIQGAVRETLEETGSRVDVVGPLAMLDIPHIGQTYALFRAQLPQRDFAPTPESLEVRLFEPAQIPWEELAFPVVHFALRFYVEDLEAGREHLHLGIVRWSGTGRRYDPSNYRVEERLAVPLGNAGGAVEAF